MGSLEALVDRLGRLGGAPRRSPGRLGRCSRPGGHAEHPGSARERPGTPGKLVARALKNLQSWLQQQHSCEPWGTPLRAKGTVADFLETSQSLLLAEASRMPETGAEKRCCRPNLSADAETAAHDSTLYNTVRAYAADLQTDFTQLWGPWGSVLSQCPLKPLVQKLAFFFDSPQHCSALSPTVGA